MTSVEYGNVTVANKYKLSGELAPNATDIHIGRPSVLGNPFPMKTKSDRSKVIALYRTWLWSQIKLKGAVYQELRKIALLVSSGKNVRLICFCAPQPCHGDIIVKAVYWLLDGG